ncbi:hypothetical protein HBB16_06175 [Pseudonocardia sp. MCCB 268]|nr:hypothetical protein [Pseudonocardia cytotoxica]
MRGERPAARSRRSGTSARGTTRTTTGTRRTSARCCRFGSRIVCATLAIRNGGRNGHNGGKDQFGRRVANPAAGSTSVTGSSGTSWASGQLAGARGAMDRLAAAVRGPCRGRAGGADPRARPEAGAESVRDRGERHPTCRCSAGGEFVRSGKASTCRRRRSGRCPPTCPAVTGPLQARCAPGRRCGCRPPVPRRHPGRRYAGHRLPGRPAPRPLRGARRTRPPDRARRHCAPPAPRPPARPAPPAGTPGTRRPAPRSRPAPLRRRQARRSGSRPGEPARVTSGTPSPGSTPTRRHASPAGTARPRRHPRQPGPPGRLRDALSRPGQARFVSGAAAEALAGAGDLSRRRA